MLAFVSFYFEVSYRRVQEKRFISKGSLTCLGIQRNAVLKKHFFPHKLQHFLSKAVNFHTAISGFIL